MSKVYGMYDTGEGSRWVPENPEAWGLGLEIDDAALKQRVDGLLQAYIKSEAEHFSGDFGDDLANQRLFSDAPLELSSEEQMEYLARRLWWEINVHKREILSQKPQLEILVREQSDPMAIEMPRNWRHEYTPRFDGFTDLATFAVLFGKHGKSRDKRGRPLERFKFRGRQFPLDDRDFTKAMSNLQQTLQEWAGRGLSVPPIDLANFRLLGGDIKFLPPEQLGQVISHAKQELALAEQRLRHPQHDELEPFHKGPLTFYDDPQGGFLITATRAYVRAASVLRVLSAESLEFLSDGVKLKDPEGLVKQ